ncbi:hypothetical protein OH77DRAFT_1393127 [Trametes cingulata]|nr:hypothetical protein OH77DRAFT_1393127 [Trametes cingulata]
MAARNEGLASNPHDADNAKRPKLQRACDLCRKKKSDGTEMPNGRCSKCISYGVDCTYDSVNRRPSTRNYVELLESRLQKMEELVDKLQPKGQTNQEDHNAGVDGTPPAHSPEPAPPNQGAAASTLPPPPFSMPSPAECSDLDPSDDEMEASRKLVSSFRQFSLRPITMRYHGKSSGMMLLQAAVDMKKECTGLEGQDLMPLPPSSYAQNPAMCAPPFFADDLPPLTEFPPPELMKTLVDAYFAEMNAYMPALHRPLFERQMEEGFHLRDPGFGAIVLLVCANGARFVEDPWIADLGEPEADPPGWKYFQQVEKARKSLFAPSTLYDLQKCVLMSEYLGSFGSPHHCWTVVGLGLRIAQDMGVHRQKTYSVIGKTEGELRRRSFWCLIIFDRIVSFGLGRPCALQEEDFDVAPVAECDDEYWDTEDEENPFKQPPGKPAKAAFVNCFNRLVQILAFASRTIYSINKSKVLMGFVGQEWEERIVAELDSLLNKWVDTVPDHLRWDPHREDILFLNQSTVLYSQYYQHQIFVHRPFLPSTRKSDSRLSLPSLAICTNAARCCVHINDIQFKRTGRPLLYTRMPLCTAGLVLLLNMWGGKRSGLSNASAAADVQKCISMLRLLESRSRTAGKILDFLTSLYSAGNFKAPEQPPVSRKRARDYDLSEPSSFTNSRSKAPPQPTSSASGGPNGATTEGSQAQTIHTPSTVSSNLGSSSTPEMGSEPWSEPSTASSPTSFELPISTEDLGRVPFTHGFSPFFNDAFAQKPQQSVPQEVQNQSFAQFSGQVPWSGPGPGAFDAASAFEGGAATASYNDMYAAMAAMPQSAGQSAAFLPQSSSTMNPPLGDMGGANGELPTLTEEDLALADNTLDVWSSAPATLEWGDWGQFINDMSGGGAGWSASQCTGSF